MLRWRRWRQNWWWSRARAFGTGVLPCWIDLDLLVKRMLGIDRVRWGVAGGDGKERVGDEVGRLRAEEVRERDPLLVGLRQIGNGLRPALEYTLGLG